MGKAVDIIFQKIAIPVIASAAVLLLFLAVYGTRTTSSENNAYVRVINCIISYVPENRTREDIEGCYVQVENDLGTHLKRYDSSGRQ